MMPHLFGGDFVSDEVDDGIDVGVHEVGAFMANGFGESGADFLEGLLHFLFVVFIAYDNQN